MSFLTGSKPNMKGSDRLLGIAGDQSQQLFELFQQLIIPFYGPLIGALAERAGIQPHTLPKGQIPGQQTPPPSTQPSIHGGAQGAQRPATNMFNLSPGATVSGVPAPGVGQGAGGVQQGTAMLGAQGANPLTQQAPSLDLLRSRFGNLPGLPGHPPPAPTPQPGPAPQLPGAPPVNPFPNPTNPAQGFRPEEQIVLNQGIDRIQREFGRIGNQATFGAGQRLGGTNNSINAGLQRGLARDQGDAISQLAQNMSLQSVQEQERRMMVLLQALGMGSGFGGQGMQGALGAGGAAGQLAMGRNQRSGGLLQFLPFFM